MEALFKKNLCQILCTLLLYLFVPIVARSQVVPNGSFEQHTAGWTNYTTWVVPNGSSPDYFHRGASQVPRNCTGYQFPHPVSDSAYVGIYVGHIGNVGDYNEFVQAKLNAPLMGGRSYLVKFYTNFAGWRADGGTCTGTGNNSLYTNAIGAYFSNMAITHAGPQTFTEIPQIKATDWLKDTLDWMLIQGVLTVPTDSVYNYITIGAFGTNPPGLAVPYGDAISEAGYYFIDDVSVDSCFAWAGPDTTICKGKCIDLPIPADKDIAWTYKAISGDLNSISNGNRVCPNTTTTYVLTTIDPRNCCTQHDTVTVHVAYCCGASNCFSQQSLLTNGDFEDGPTGVDWTGDYNLNNTLSPGHGGVVQDAAPITYGAGYTEGLDHTLADGSGWFLLLDGHCRDCSPLGVPPPNKGWCKTVTVKPNTFYDFTAWIMNIQKTTSPYSNEPIIQFKVNGQLICSPVSYPRLNMPNKWQAQACAWWSGSTSGSVEICVMLEGINMLGNDVGIDDICFTPRAPSAGPDLNICQGDSVVLPVDTHYTWSYKVLSGDMSSLNGNVAKPTITSTYLYTVIDPNNTSCSVIDTLTVYVKKCCLCPDSCSVPGPDLIINGGFDMGFAGFTSDYHLNPGPGTMPQDYYVLTTVNGFDAGTWKQNGNPGQFLYVDGDSTNPNRGAWREVISGLTIGRKYIFCFDVNNLMDTSYDYADPVVQVRMNGTPIGSVSVPEKPDSWQRISFNWTATSTTDTITIVDMDTTWIGNDFGIDNISFRACIPKVPSNAGPDTTICLGGTATLYPGPPAPLTWSYQVLNDGPPYSILTNVVSPKHTTIYVLSVYDPVSHCESFDTVVVHVVCCHCIEGGNPASNLITNGDFSAGNTGFSTMYTLGSPTSPGAGYYWVQPTSSTVSSSWDKTGNPGKFLFVDGATSSSYYFWRQTVSVTPYKPHSLCMDGVNLNTLPGFPTPNDPVVAVYINGSLVASETLDETYGWMPIKASWNSGSSSTATIEVYTLNTSAPGNDLGVDNIRFVPCDDPPPPGRPEPAGSGSTNNNNTPNNGEGAVNIYPNPASSSIKVFVSSGLQEVEKVIVMDMSGKTVHQVNPAQNQGKTLDMSVADLHRGTYLIAVYNHTGCVGKKMFLKK